MKEKGLEANIEQWIIYYYNLNSYAACKILMEATTLGKENFLRWLLHESKYDVNEQSINGMTALDCAVLDNQMECARWLLDVGSQNLKNRASKTPLDYAKRYGRTEIANLLESHFHSSLLFFIINLSIIILIIFVLNILMNQ